MINGVRNVVRFWLRMMLLRLLLLFVAGVGARLVASSFSCSASVAFNPHGPLLILGIATMLCDFEGFVSNTGVMFLIMLLIVGSRVVTVIMTLLHSAMIFALLLEHGSLGSS